MLFRKGIDPRCIYCARGARINDEQMLCAKRGIVQVEHHCSSFRYDPLKRVPSRPIVLHTENLQKEDFEL
ncbi:MAG: hypothetical protein KBS74_08395 [Clostridiales bacterium]|nr:hypothetical protein [Candidatus Cacconaster stercorequi]